MSQHLSIGMGGEEVFGTLTTEAPQEYHGSLRIGRKSHFRQKTKFNQESDERMAGLRNICRMHGGMTVSKDGKTIHYVWDYDKEEPVDKKLMTKARQKASDIAWAMKMKAQNEEDLRTNKSGKNE